jgi:hypothetical protein
MSDPQIDSRAVLRLRAARSVSHDIHPESGGLAIHWGGEKMGLGTQPHESCRAAVRQWQAFHMDTRGWVDIAYNWVICNHGVIMTGRGWNVRSAANGTNDSNDHYVAACWLGGLGDPDPSAAARFAFGWLARDIQSRGAAPDVQPHRHFYNTDCPGAALVAVADTLRAAKPSTATPPFPLPAGSYFGPVDGPPESVSGYYSHRSDLAKWQARIGLGLVADGLYGPATAASAKVFQHGHGLDPDGLIGRDTWDAAWPPAWN